MWLVSRVGLFMGTITRLECMTYDELRKHLRLLNRKRAWYLNEYGEFRFTQDSEDYETFFEMYNELMERINLVKSYLEMEKVGDELC